MAEVLTELRDPYALGLAVVVVAVNVVIGVRPWLAAIAGVLVVAVRIVAGLVWPKASVGTPPLRGPLAKLSKRELEVAKLVAQGLANRQIGRSLFIQEDTVENHLTHIYNKTGFNNRAQLAAEYVRRFPNPT